MDFSEKNFLSIIKQNQGIIYKICNVYTNTVDDKNDLFQEIVLQLWRAFPNYRQESKISTWMYRIALNVAFTGIRKKSRTLQTTELTNNSFEIPDVKEENYNEELKQLHHAIQQLNDTEKAIILLYLDDKPYEEIANITGITANYVAVKIIRIKEKLKQLMNV